MNVAEKGKSIEKEEKRRKKHSQCVNDSFTNLFELLVLDMFVYLAFYMFLEISSFP